ncbi:hypothetical protein [Thiohalobacter sp.]|uniref:hypothetical protein n=1 Tax=Thiohalobacter sp. TaxID=2025948 RepID=UPI0026068BDE|nr:hypothetical protein [Thiohalobacter sp.]
MTPRRLFAHTLLTALVQSLLLGGLFMYAAYRRALTLPAEALAPCARVAEPARQADCLNLALHAHLTAPPHLALLFVVLLVAALLPAWLAARAAGSQALGQALLIAMSSAALLLAFMEPGRLPALAAFVGSVLAGLIVARFGHARMATPNTGA